ncbi:Cytochrome b5-like Heme/Steroid binding domain, partial [Geosmithia morbida]
MADSAELRQRKPQQTAHDDDDNDDDNDGPVETKKEIRKKIDSDDDDRFTFYIDILRVITFLTVASFGLSYVISGGQSWVWGGVRLPEYLTVDYWKEQMKGPVYMSPEELAGFDGRDPDKPVYLAINGTIYDVSARRQIYGPGGGYGFFSGKDASRAFVTGCFAEDLTPDMRGVEDMFLPVDDPDVDSYWTAEEMEEMRAAELEAARAKAHDALKHWVGFFAGNAKYKRVGYVVREEGWLEKEPRRELCAQALKSRPKRKIPGDEKQ